MDIDIPYVKKIIGRAYERQKERVGSDQIAEMAIPSYLGGNAASRWFAWSKVALNLKVCGNPSNAHILDYGCGSGIMFHPLRDHFERLYAVDINYEVAKTTAGLLNLDRIRFLYPDALDSAVGDGTLDIIFAANVLEHVDSLEGCLGMFKRKLKKNGVVIVSGPTENFLYGMGRRILLATGHREFKGDYHVTNIHHIHDTFIGMNYERVELNKFPFPGPFALYWILKFRKTDA